MVGIVAGSLAALGGAGAWIVNSVNKRKTSAEMLAHGFNPRARRILGGLPIAGLALIFAYKKIIINRKG